AELKELRRSWKQNPTRPPARFRSLISDTPEHPHFFPQPRVAIGRALVRRRLATTAIDVSDGLSVDLLHICEESGLRAEVDAALLPLGAGATLEDALHGGDDYELLFTAGPRVRVPNRIAGVPVRRIGRMRPKKSGAPWMVLVENGQRREW